GHVEAILQPHAELARQIDAGLVRKAHADGQPRRLAMDEIDRLMPVEADTVARAMRQAGQLVARPIAETFVETAHRVIDAARRRADVRGLDRCLLALADLIPHFALFGAGGAVDESA